MSDHAPFRDNLSYEICKAMQNVKIPVLSHTFGDLGLMHRVHLWLDRKRIVDFVLVTIIELFSLALTADALLGEISVN